MFYVIFYVFSWEIPRNILGNPRRSLGHASLLSAYAGSYIDIRLLCQDFSDEEDEEYYSDEEDVEARPAQARCTHIAHTLCVLWTP